jgi:hypothetical protein
MGKLKSLTFQAKTGDGKRLVTKTIESMSPDNVTTNIRQLPDKTPIVFPEKKSVEAQTESDFQEILTTCENNYVKSKQDKKNTRAKPLAYNIYYSDNHSWLSECDELL